METQSTGQRDQAVKILAKTLFRQMTSDGYENRQIVALSSELIALVTSALTNKTTVTTDAT